MPLTTWNCVCLISRRIISVTFGMFFQEIISIKEFPGSNLLLPTKGSSSDFQVADLLLANVYFEPCVCVCVCPAGI